VRRREREIVVGLEAPDERARVELAMAEFDRTMAFDRSVLMLISPTGTGYVHYCAVAAAEYLTLGDIATAAVQYSKRPSPVAGQDQRTPRFACCCCTYWTGSTARRTAVAPGSSCSERASARTPARTC
jgi:hypothetical protein